MVDKSPELLVVGGGLAGMVVANGCAEEGMRVAVVEKGTEPGGSGNARISTGLFHLAWQPLDAPPQVIEETIVEATDGEADSDLVRALARGARAAGEWLSAEGVVFRPSRDEPVYRWHVFPHGTNVRTAHQPERGTELMMKTLYQNFERRGGTVLYGRRALAAVPGAEGWRVTTTDSSGRRAALSTGAVCLADGGFQASAEMLCRYVGPQADRLVLRSMPTQTGDGLRIALEVGGAAVGLGRFYGHIVSADAATKDLWPYPSLDSLCVAGVMIHCSGRCIEGVIDNGIQLANWLARTEDPMGWAVVVSEEQWRALGQDAPPGGFSAYHDLQRLGGRVFIDSDVDALAASLHVPPARLGQALAQRQAGASRWVGVPVAPGITFTAGGIKIDAAGRALDVDGAPVPNLFAAGSNCGGMHGGPRGGYIGGLAVAAITGLAVTTSVCRS